MIQANQLLVCLYHYWGRRVFAYDAGSLLSFIICGSPASGWFSFMLFTMREICSYKNGDTPWLWASSSVRLMAILPLTV